MALRTDEDFLETILSLAFVAEFRDSDTTSHLRRISRVSRLLALASGIEPERADTLALAAPLHDIGKVAIPDDILLKPGSLTAEERRTMQDHTVIGQKLLAEGRGTVLQLAALIARSHQERWDGSGYPDRLRGEDIPLEGRIVGLADAFDGMVSHRVYKAARPFDDAVEALQAAAGRQFDPALVAAFLSQREALAELYVDVEGIEDDDDDDWPAV